MPDITSGNPTARRFAGKDCVISGAGSGIGRAIALRLAAEGARVAVLDINTDAADETLELCGGSGRGLAVSIDVWDEVMAVNLRGPYLTSRIFLPQLLQRADTTGGAAI
eukprot:gene61602-84252_t